MSSLNTLYWLSNTVFGFVKNFSSADHFQEKLEEGNGSICLNAELISQRDKERKELLDVYQEIEKENPQIVSLLGRISNKETTEHLDPLELAKHLEYIVKAAVALSSLDGLKQLDNQLTEAVKTQANLENLCDELEKELIGLQKSKNAYESYMRQREKNLVDIIQLRHQLPLQAPASCHTDAKV